jgi:fucose permease
MLPAAAGLASATPYITTIPAVLLVPRLVPPRLRGRIITLLILLYGVSIMWVVATDKVPIFGLLLSGASGPSIFPLLLLILMDIPEVGPKYLGSATGVFFCFSEMGGFLGPFIVGFLVDYTGTFMTGAVFLLLLVLVISSLMYLLKPEAAVGMNRN